MNSYVGVRIGIKGSCIVVGWLWIQNESALVLGGGWYCNYIERLTDVEAAHKIGLGVGWSQWSVRLGVGVDSGADSAVALGRSVCEDEILWCCGFLVWWCCCYWCLGAECWVMGWLMEGFGDTNSCSWFSMSSPRLLYSVTTIDNISLTIWFDIFSIGSWWR